MMRKRKKEQRKRVSEGKGKKDVPQGSGGMERSNSKSPIQGGKRARQFSPGEGMGGRRRGRGTLK